MARSKHTDPKEIRAQRRVRSPRGCRSQDDTRRRQRLGALLKEMGIASRELCPPEPGEPVFPRLIRRRPRPGYFHPASRVDIRRILAFVGPVAVYGIRSIELIQSATGQSTTFPLLGQLKVPGRILLFEQSIGPWELSGRLAAEEEDLIRQAGAEVEVESSPWTTQIVWPEDTLRDFMLFDVLLHEIGHHVLQHHKGKRSERVARTRDHEAFAQRFARNCRRAWFEDREAS